MNKYLKKEIKKHVVYGLLAAFVGTAIIYGFAFLYIVWINLQ